MSVTQIALSRATRLSVRVEPHETREFAWFLSQSESRVSWDEDGMLWTAPWGEEIKFFEKQKTRRDRIPSTFCSLIPRTPNAASMLYLEWETVPAGGNSAKSKGWTVSGRQGKKGRRFVYRGDEISRIAAPSGGKTAFERATDDHLLRVLQLGTARGELVFAPDCFFSVLVASNVTNHFSFTPTPLAILPKTDAESVVAATRPRLVSARTGDFDSIEFSYECNYLSCIRFGPFSASLRVKGAIQIRAFVERIARVESGFRPPLGLNVSQLFSDGSLSYGTMAARSASPS